MRPPQAKQITHIHSHHGHERVDPYYWLNQRDHPDVLEYLNQENEYADYILQPTQNLQKQLIQEMKGRIKENESSSPYFLDGYYYYSKYDTGKEYPIYCRKKSTLQNNEEIILDVNELAKDHAYCEVSGLSISPQHDRIAFALDTNSRRIYSIVVWDISKQSAILTASTHASNDIEWATDNNHLFFIETDEQTLRSHRVYRFSISENKKKEVYDEKDETFHLGLNKTASRKYLLIEAHSTLTSEIFYIPSSKPLEKWKSFHSRTKGHEYDIDHSDGFFFIHSNDQARNFQIFSCPDNSIAKENWKTFVPHNENIFLENFQAFKTHIAIEEKKDGLTRIHLKNRKTNEDQWIDFSDKAYSVNLYQNVADDRTEVRVLFESLATPPTIYDANLLSLEKKIIKEKEVPGYDKSLYTTDRLHIPARDGQQIPVSIIYKKNINLNQANPLLLYGYGSYGINIDPYFNSNLISLLDRGFIYAIAHIRGGSQLGRPWYESGKLLNKMNTFNDFIDCAQHLIKSGMTNSDHLYAYGGSAGGLLMGAIMNMRPELFNGVIAAVPFVDVVTTMLDDTIPLTTGEYDEWGNPHEPHFYNYMLSYSPYDNVSAQNYPHLLITTGLHDSQVQYWEPAKWAAKLRSTKTDNHLLLLKTEMKEGHGGASGRFTRLKNIALNYAFLLHLEKISNPA